MTIIDKLISDGIINKDDCSDKVLYTICKECCKQTEDFPLEEVITNDKELCKNCIFYDTCVH